MRAVSIGDLVTDYYYKNEKFLGINLETIEDIVFSSIEDYKTQK